MIISWMGIYRAARDLLITSAALYLLFVEVKGAARTEVLLLIASMLSIPTFLRGSSAIGKAATNGGRHE